ncbi:MAG: ABC transporter permease [Bacteroidia bacterium]|nr:ABC transporter permease [Bacteroidia bacterium]
MNAAFLLTALMQGLAFAGLGCGIYLSLRIFKIPDITTDGSYTLGGVVTAIGLTAGVHPLLSMCLAVLCGMLAGACSGIIHTKLKVNALLAGILVMTALYSVHLILLGRPNLPLIDTPGFLHDLPFGSALSKTLLSLLASLLLLLGILHYLLRSDFGIAMRATGNNEAMARAMGINTDTMKVTGLALANGCIALSGSLITRYQGFADVNMGIGIVISGLGAVMIGETLFRKGGGRSILRQLLALATGCILFRMAIALALSAGVDPNYLRLITSLIVLTIVAIGQYRQPAAP